MELWSRKKVRPVSTPNQSACLYTVLLFARRRAFAAIRTGDAGAVVDAFDALSAVDVERVDWRDVVVASSLAAYSASRAGTVARTAAAGTIDRAEARVAEIVAGVADQDESYLARSCGYRIVTTADGPALFEEGYRPYRPERDLVPIAMAVAAAIERDGTYRITRLKIGSDLPMVWLGAGAGADQLVAAAVEGMTGCVSIDAYLDTGAGYDLRGHFLFVYLAEGASAQDAAVIAQGADRGSRSGSVVTGVASARLCVVSVAKSAVADQQSVENAETMARFRPAIMALLG